MAPLDPRLRPALEVAKPGDSGAADPDYRPDDSPWDFIFGDGKWHPVKVIAWWKDRRGRQVVQVEFHAAGSTWEGSYLVAAEKMREPED